MPGGCAISSRGLWSTTTTSGWSCRGLDSRRWILSNDGVRDEVLSPEFAAESAALAMRRLREVFHREQTDWLGALSRFYLRQRMQRWAGITITDGCRTRLALNPLVDSEVLACTWAVPTRQRAGSRYAVRVLGHLDEELARIPLGSGLRPVALDRTLTMTRRLGENTWRGFLGKAGNKSGAPWERGAGPPSERRTWPRPWWRIGVRILQHWNPCSPPDWSIPRGPSASFGDLSRWTRRRWIFSSTCMSSRVVLHTVSDSLRD